LRPYCLFQVLFHFVALFGMCFNATLPQSLLSRELFGQVTFRHHQVRNFQF
jgi:hypothetical protein